MKTQTTQTTQTPTPYVYRATVVNVHDGDTITVNVNLGFKLTFQDLDVRLDGLNAPELNTDAGKLSQEFLSKTIMGKDIVLVTKKDATEKYGRYLGTIFLGDINVNILTIESGFAKPWNGRGVKPI